MGIALWVACGFAAFLIARLIPIRRRGRAIEMIAGVAAAIVGGLVATALDFGGWNELDWRAGAFDFLIALAAVALVRLWPIKTHGSR